MDSGESIAVVGVDAASGSAAVEEAALARVAEAGLAAPPVGVPSSMSPLTAASWHPWTSPPLCAMTPGH